MGLNLDLLPFWSPTSNFSQDLLQFKVPYGLVNDFLITSGYLKLFDKILELERKKGKKVPENFKSFHGKEGYGKTIETPYGDLVKYVLAGDLLDCFNKNLKHIDNWTNKAILAYLKEMPRDWKVALYWH